MESQSRNQPISCNRGCHEHMADGWQFDATSNSRAFTTKFVLEGSPILRVYHDFDDGGWQFHGSFDQPATQKVARLVCLGCMIAKDGALDELHDLPRGWRAFRESPNMPWKREKNNPFPTYAENGYYLEDAVWMAQYRDDIHLPSEELRSNLEVGTYVKLLFRFAPENAERQDDETERMWVCVTDIDEDENYIGELSNDPHHSNTLAFGDTVHFVWLHVMDIQEGGDS